MPTHPRLLQLLTLTTLLTSTAPLPAQSPAVPNPQTTTAPATAASATPAEIDHLIQQLADKDFPTREAADKKLRAIGWPAMSSLIVAKANTTDEESKSRLATIIESLCWNTDELPPESAKLVNDFRDANAADHEIARMKLGNDSAAAPVALRSVAILGLSPTGLGGVFRFAPEGAERIANLQRHGSWAQLEWELIGGDRLSDLQFVLKSRPMDAAPLLAALMAIRHDRPESHYDIDKFLVAITLTEDESKSLTLAENLGLKDYQTMILARRQDWQALAKLPAGAGAGGKVFSGDGTGADELLSAMIAQAFQHSDRDVCDLPVPVVLLGRVALINAGCLRYPTHDQAVAMLLNERRYADAMKLHSDPNAPRKVENIGGGTDGRIWGWGPTEVMNAQTDARLAWALARLNEPDQAITEIKRLDEFGKVPYFLDQADRALNRPESIINRLNRTIDKLSDPATSVAEVLTDNDPLLALWARACFLSTHDVEATRKELEKFRHGELVAEDIRALAASLPKQDLRSASDPSYSSFALALLAAQCGFNDIAKEYLDKALLPGDRQFRRRNPLQDFEIQGPLALFLFKLTDPTFPSQLFVALTALSNAHPSIKYIYGLYQMRHGQEVAGDAVRREGDLLLAGDVNQRLGLARTLLALGETELAKEQLNLVILWQTPATLFDTRNLSAYRLLAGLEQKENSFKAALQHYRLEYFSSLAEGHYVGQSFDEHYKFARNLTYCEARVALEEGNRDSALRAAVGLVTADPEDIDLTSQLITAFQTAHLDDQAPSLANLNRNLLENILKDFPNSHLHHFLIAQLDLSTNTVHPDSEGPNSTATHLARAQQLAPQNPTYQKLHLP